jgi:hypothetical protein
MHSPLLNIFVPAVVAFVIGIAITPLVTHYLYKYKVWKKQAHRIALNGTVAEVFHELRGDLETKTPRMVAL